MRKVGLGLRGNPLQKLGWRLQRQRSNSHGVLRNNRADDGAKGVLFTEGGGGELFGERERMGKFLKGTWVVRRQCGMQQQAALKCDLAEHHQHKGVLPELLRRLGAINEQGMLDRIERDRIAAGGDPSLPRLLIAGPLLDVLGSFSTQIYGVSNRVALVESPTDACAETAAILDGGADLIKLAVSGRTDVSWAELSDAELAAIVATVRARGTHVVAPVDRAVALRRAVEQGVSQGGCKVSAGRGAGPARPS